MMPSTPSKASDIVGVPTELVVDKTLDHLDPHARAFIALSPIVVVSAADAEGRCVSSPRGDPPGFVKILDDTTLLLPDRKGNRRVDAMMNITATITADADLLARCAVKGAVPALGILVGVEEVFVHCARAFLRSRLWQPDTWPDRSALPTLGKMLHDQMNLHGSVEALDRELDEANRDLY